MIPIGKDKQSFAVAGYVKAQQEKYHGNYCRTISDQAKQSFEVVCFAPCRMEKLVGPSLSKLKNTTALIVLCPFHI